VQSDVNEQGLRIVIILPTHPLSFVTDNTILLGFVTN
jgi:hypothetical protein